MNQGRDLFINVWAAVVGGKEAFIGGWVSAIGVTCSAALGGWDKAIEVLLTLMVLDYVSGVAGAIKNQKLSSDTMYWGGFRKIVVLSVVMLASLLDDWLQPGSPIFRTAAIYFYSGREGLSLIENFGTLGVPLPFGLKKILEQLNEKGDKDINT